MQPAKAYAVCLGLGRYLAPLWLKLVLSQYHSFKRMQWRWNIRRPPAQSATTPGTGCVGVGPIQATSGGSAPSSASYPFAMRSSPLMVSQAGPFNASTPPTPGT
eukprot:373240-Prymnesium_polylepis.1